MLPTGPMSRPHRPYERLGQAQREYLWFGAIFVFQGIIMCLPTEHPVVIAFGLASLLGAIYFFFLAWDTGKQRKMMLHGVFDERALNKMELRASRQGREQRRGLRFLILACTITLMLILLFG